MKQPQWITAGIAVFLLVIIYLFGRTIPRKGEAVPVTAMDEASRQVALKDTILSMARRQISPDQLQRITALENSISRGDVKDQRLKVYHQLAHFWRDSAQLLLPSFWYEAESARLENSEKSLTFAARLFLDNLQGEQNPEFKKWEALQARDLFERSLTINPANDSAKIGLGACYLFGNISETPMEGINKIREVLNRDSTNVYGQLTLARAAVMTGQYANAIHRLELVNRIDSTNVDATLQLADIYEKSNDKSNAIKWYQKSLSIISRPDVREAIAGRIEELKK